MKKRAVKAITLGIVIAFIIFPLGIWGFLARNKRVEPTIDRNALIQLFDELDQKVNNGKGYSDYLNTDGFPTGALLAWSESYLMQAYANMYRATGNMKYMDKLYDHIQSVLANRDDKIGKKNYRNEFAPTWGTNRYTNGKEWMNFAVHTGMITYPMLEFAQIVKDFHIEKYFDVTDEILKEVEKSVKYHDKEWRVEYYVYPEDFYQKDYILPVSQQSAMGRSLILLYILTAKEECKNKVFSLAEFIKGKSVIEHDSGGYLLRGVFLPGKTTPEDKIVDISHATLIIHFAYLAYNNSIIFDEEDMRKFTKTIKRLAVNNNNHFPTYLDNTGKFDYGITAGQYAFLAEFDREVYDSIIDLLFNHLKIDQTAKYMQEDWWGTVMLGLSRLVLYHSNF